MESNCYTRKSDIEISIQAFINKKLESKKQQFISENQLSKQSTRR